MSLVNRLWFIHQQTNRRTKCNITLTSTPAALHTQSLLLVMPKQDCTSRKCLLVDTLSPTKAATTVMQFATVNVSKLHANNQGVPNEPHTTRHDWCQPPQAWQTRRGCLWLPAVPCHRHWLCRTACRMVVIMKYSQSAFPYILRSKDGSSVVSQGMTLRDYFAASFVESGHIFKSMSDGNTPELVAEQAYALADAMLKAREQWLISKTTAKNRAPWMNW